LSTLKENSVQENKMAESPVSQVNIASSLSDEQRAKNAFNISIVTAILLGALLILTIIINRSFTADLPSLITLGAGAAIFGMSARLSRLGKSDTGILLNIIVLTIIISTRVFVQQGLALQIGIVYFVLISTMSIYTLSPKWSGWAVVTAFVVAVITIIIDQNTTGIPQSPSAEYVTWIAVIVGVMYLVILAMQFQSLPLRAKLIIGFIFLAITPLIVLGYLTYSTSQKILRDQVKANLLESSVAASTSLDNFIESQFNTISTEARLSYFVNYLAPSQTQRGNSSVETQALETLQTLSEKNFVESYALINNLGTNVLDTDSSNIGNSYADQDFFRAVIAEQRPFLSNRIRFQQDGEAVIHFAAPILSRAGNIIGILLVKYNADILQSTLQNVTEGRSTASEYTYLVDDDYFIVLGHSSRPDYLYKSLLAMDDRQLAELQQSGAMKSGDPHSLLLPQPEVTGALQDMAHLAVFQAPSQENEGEQAEVTAARVPNTSWIVVSAQPVDAIAILTQPQTRATILSSIIITVIAALVALIASSFFTDPIIQLTRVAENISMGDFTKKADVRQKDEIGTLAQTFNNMTDQIQELIETLERRVEQRTAALEQATNQSEKRARDLETITEVSRSVATEKDLENLLPFITRVVSERFGFYHVGIFLLDENKKYAVLRAANSPGGQAMLRRQHKLEVGRTGIVGAVTSNGIPRVALDTGTDAIYFNNPDLPETRSEMALPLIARGTIIGALDVQSTFPNAFTDADVSVVSLLTDQIAIAIDNARLLEETQVLLAESQAIFREYLAEAWQKRSTSSILGYHQTLTGGRAITLQAVNETKPLNDDEIFTLAIPIRVREQVIGVLNIRSNSDGKSWSDEEVNVVKAVAERLGLALDNARLFEETSTRAERERLVSEITTKIRGTNDPQEMIQKAVEELKRTLGVTRIEIIPQKNSPPDN
jgi:GAF domain-containing protein/HAMP domain-containing protein